MVLLDVDTLLEPVSDDSPCGPNLEYDDAYASFERSARGKAEQQYGETIIPAEDPNWREVRRLGLELVLRTKDLRVACLLVRGLLETEGLRELASSLALVRGYLERFWPSVHPQLDPDDQSDPTLRVNTVSSLSNQATTIRSLRDAPLVEARGLGRFSLRHLGMATGDIPSLPNEEPPKLATIEAAFSQCDLDQLKADVETVRLSLDHVDAIDSILTEHVGSARAIGLDDLRTTLKELQQVLSDNLFRREPSTLGDSVSGQSADPTANANQGQMAASRTAGEIRSREDVVATLDRICQYYNRYEPSSPLPLLLGRAKRLASKSFMEIVKDLTPEAVPQIQRLSGADEDGAGE